MVCLGSLAGSSRTGNAWFLLLTMWQLSRWVGGCPACRLPPAACRLPPATALAPLTHSLVANRYSLCRACVLHLAILRWKIQSLNTGSIDSLSFSYILPAILQVAYECVDMCVRPAFLGGALIWRLLSSESGSSVEGQPRGAAELQQKQVEGIALLAQTWHSTQSLQDIVAMAQLWVGVSGGHSLIAGQLNGSRVRLPPTAGW